MRFFYLIFISFFFSGCYTCEQTYEQAKILLSRQPLSKAIKENSNNIERLEKLKLVGPVLEFSQKEWGLTPQNSYQKYVELSSPYVSWVVQAADRHRLVLKTWWFPIVGTQPYLGYFQKESALEEARYWKKKNYDVTIGGVKAFSLLGYFDDPLYSSMIDGVSTPSFIETLIHETVHRTIYVKDHYAFNENLANFIARKGTEIYLRQHSEIGVNWQDYIAEIKKNNVAQRRFQEFLLQVKKELGSYYQDLGQRHPYTNEEEFLQARQAKFDEISDRYHDFMAGSEKGTSYDYAFAKGKFNNATILGYGVYEDDQVLLEKLFQKSNENLKQFVSNLKKCSADLEGNENHIWESLDQCMS